MTDQALPTPEAALAPIVEEIQQLRQRGFTHISVRNPDTGVEHKLVFPVLPPRHGPWLIDDPRRMGLGLYREVFNEARLLGEVYINPKYPDMVGLHLRLPSLTPAEARIIAAELLDVARQVEARR